MTRQHKQLAAAGVVVIGIGLLFAGVSWTVLLPVAVIAAMMSMHLGGHGGQAGQAGHGGHGGCGGSEPSTQQHPGSAEAGPHSHGDAPRR